VVVLTQPIRGGDGQFSGRKRRTLSRNNVIYPGPAEPLSDHCGRHLRRRDQQWRAASWNGVNDVGTAAGSYFGGPT
jgi:hypothetical protein